MIPSYPMSGISPILYAKKAALSKAGTKKEAPPGFPCLLKEHNQLSREVKKGRNSFFFTPRAAALRQARVSGGDLQNREIVFRLGTGDARFELALVRQNNEHLVFAFDPLVIGGDSAGRTDDKA